MIPTNQDLINLIHTELNSCDKVTLAILLTHGILTHNKLKRFYVQLVYHQRCKQIQINGMDNKGNKIHTEIVMELADTLDVKDSLVWSWTYL